MSKVRARFGGRLRFFISGSAALNADVARWFDAAGLPVLEGYGLTETTAASTLNHPSDPRPGTVGPALPGTEVRIADDGEVLLRSPGVMEGYHNDPDATAEVLTPDGWLRTGDIGRLDQDGYLSITDRKKELFKTSNGKYVAPSAVAATFKGISPLATDLVVVGENRPYCTALVGLDAEAARTLVETNGAGVNSAGAGGAGTAFAELAAHPTVRAALQQHIDTLNAGLNRWEQVKRFTVAPRPLTVQDGDLTPSLKLRRKNVLAAFAGEVEGLYR